MPRYFGSFSGLADSGQLLATFPQDLRTESRTSGLLIRLRDQIGMGRMIRCCFVDRDTF